jgi:hypothetical protein
MRGISWSSGGVKGFETRAVSLAITHYDNSLTTVIVTNQFECETFSWVIRLFLRLVRDSWVPGLDRLQTLLGRRKEKVDSEMQRIFSNSFPNLKDVVKQVLMSSYCVAMTKARTGSSLDYKVWRFLSVLHHLHHRSIKYGPRTAYSPTFAV